MPYILTFRYYIATHRGFYADVFLASLFPDAFCLFNLIKCCVSLQLAKYSFFLFFRKSRKEDGSNHRIFIPPYLYPVYWQAQSQIYYSISGDNCLTCVIFRGSHRWWKKNDFKRHWSNAVSTIFQRLKYQNSVEHRSVQHWQSVSYFPQGKKSRYKIFYW